MVPNYFPLVIFFILNFAKENRAIKYCDVTHVGNELLCYSKEVLIEFAHNPHQITFDVLSDTLYFSLDLGKGEHIAAAYKLQTKRLNVIKGVKDAFAMTVNPDKGEVLFGGNRGIYKYSPYEKTLRRLAKKNLDVWWLCYHKEYVYYVQFPTLDVHYYFNKTIKAVATLDNSAINQFVFDNSGNILFLNGTGLYGVKFGSDAIVKLKENPKFYAMAVDNTGLVHIATHDGVYVLSKIVKKVQKKFDLQGVLSMTFDKDNNLIYSDSHSLIRIFKE